ncbi:MAG: hypothetical protein ACXWQO_17700 [Bdellovibrionota bacterium]
MNILRHVSFLAVLLLAQSNFAHAGAVKNQQNILGGVLVRAGVSGRTQLSDQQLRTLCEQGFSQAFFLYSGATPRSISCSKGRISYRSVSWLNPAPILQAVNAGLNGGGRVFVHCLNGAHASGVIAALALRQFCRYSGEEAMAYWARTNAYGIPPGIGTIRRAVITFSPLGGMAASSSCR